MRLDHLLSRERVSRGLHYCLDVEETSKDDSGGDALRGDTRTHAEHEG